MTNWLHTISIPIADKKIRDPTICVISLQIDTVRLRHLDILEVVDLFPYYRWASLLVLHVEATRNWTPLRAGQVMILEWAYSYPHPYHENLKKSSFDDDGHHTKKHRHCSRTGTHGHIQTRSHCYAPKTPCVLFPENNKVPKSDCSMFSRCAGVSEWGF